MRKGARRRRTRGRTEIAASDTPPDSPGVSFVSAPETPDSISTFPVSASCFLNSKESLHPFTIGDGSIIEADGRSKAGPAPGEGEGEGEGKQQEKEEQGGRKGTDLVVAVRPSTVPVRPSLLLQLYRPLDPHVRAKVSLT